MSKHDRGARGSDGKARPGDPFGDITEAARSLEQELRKFEQLAQAARKMPIDTHRQIERAARATTEAAQGQESVNAVLSELVQTIQAVRERHESNVLTLAERGEEIRRRAEVIAPLYERYAALGDEGRALNERVQEAVAQQRAAVTSEQIGAFATVLEGVEVRMLKLVDDARALGQDATAAQAVDLAEQSEALRQRMAALRNKVGMLRKELRGSTAPN